jgi:RNA 3'-terminal phosphate cyclase (ATP)
MKAQAIQIDGGVGEGGGQILRTSLTLSLVTGRPLRIERIRAGRPKSGLLRQHLAAVRAAAAIGGARVRGDQIGSGELEFEPGAGDAAAAADDTELRFAVGSAGSATLVLQTILPALTASGGIGPALRRDRASIRFAGGTHNPFAPPFDFLERAYLPLLNRVCAPGPRAVVRLIRPGFYPAGGGELRLEFIDPAEEQVATANDSADSEPFDMMERGSLLELSARVMCANLPEHVAVRERDAILAHESWRGAEVAIDRAREAAGPGNAVLLFVRHAALSEVFVAFGRQGKKAEDVAGEALAEAETYLRSRAAVGEHLADQLLLPLALRGVGGFTTLPPSRHTLTNIDVIRKFLEVDIRCEEIDPDLWRIEVGG